MSLPTLRFKLSPQQRALYDAVAQAEGDTLSSVLRRIIHQHIQRVYGVNVQKAVTSEQSLTEAIEQITSGNSDA